MRSDGQSWAVAQLEAIASGPTGTLEIVNVTDPDKVGGPLAVTVSVDCRQYPHREGGVPLRSRERLGVSIPSNFPLGIPTVRFTHDRYGSFPHVQWGHSICLYQASDTEWQPSDGMFGFMERLAAWLRAGAACELDPIGLPLHPPVAYAGDKYFTVVPRRDTPTVTPPWWAGYARITRENDVCAELGDWLEYREAIPMARIAPAILLPGDMPFEYPVTIAGLKSALAARDITLEIIRLLLTMGVLRSEPGKPVLFILGAAMRGTAGQERRQHLAAWYLASERAGELRQAAIEATEDNPVDVRLFEQWAETASINWCRVLEERPEIVVRRDEGTATAYWRGRNVAILGCGAIGGAVAMFIARSGVAKLQLCDQGIVTPGILARQLFDRNQIGYTKVSATRVNVKYIDPNIEVGEFHENIISFLGDSTRLQALLSADVIIDATASVRVGYALERHFRDYTGARPPVLSMSIGHRANMALMTLASKGSSGMPLDAERRAKLAFANDSACCDLLDEFWPGATQRRRLFQPEPGCSDPTFVGSAADVSILVARMLNVASSWISGTHEAAAYAFGMHVPPTVASGERRQEVEFNWPADKLLIDLRLGYQIRVAQSAETSLLGWMRKSERLRGRNVETGGILFGQVDEFLKVIWINEVSGPPPDSVASEDGFVCGVAGVAELNIEKTNRTRGSVTFIGMWHTHPGGSPIPSSIDRAAMWNLFGRDGFSGRHFLMLIIGGSCEQPVIAGAVFDNS